MPKHCIPTSVLDPDGLVFYGGTASGNYQENNVKFFAYDVKNRKLLHTADNGYVYTISTRRDATLWRFNTKTEKIDNAAIGSVDYVTVRVGSNV